MNMQQLINKAKTIRDEFNAFPIMCKVIIYMWMGIALVLAEKIWSGSWL